MNKRLIDVLKDAVECRCRPNIDDIDAQNILFMLDDLTDERDAALADAERYRWLRDRCDVEDGCLEISVNIYSHRSPNKSDYDAAIDAAINQSK